MVHAFTSFLLEVRQQIYHIIQFHYCLYPPLHFSSFGMCFPGGTFVSFDVMSNGMKKSVSFSLYTGTKKPTVFLCLAVTAARYKQTDR